METFHFYVIGGIVFLFSLGVRQKMQSTYGKWGRVRYVGPAGSGYLGSQVSALNLSPETERLIDQEIRRLLDEAHELAMKILTDNEKALHEIAGVLQEEEVIDGETVARIAGGGPAST
jgi:cell division protease FtsH